MTPFYLRASYGVDGFSEKKSVIFMNLLSSLSFKKIRTNLRRIRNELWEK